MLKWLAPVAAAILCFLLVQGDLLAQSTVPEKPTGVAASVRGDRTLEVTWDAPSDGGSPITAYDVQYILTSQDETIVNNWTLKDNAWTSTSGALKYLAISLEADEEYDVQVRAVNSTGDGAWSDTATGTPRAKPAAPASVSLAFGDKTLTVTWDEPDGNATITDYDVRHRDLPSGSWSEERLSGPPSNLEHEITGLTNGVEYEVQVRALNVAGEGPWSTPALKETPRRVPETPDISGEPGNGNITLTWETPDDGGDDITRYDLQYVRSDVPDADKDTRWIVINSFVAPGVVMFELSGLENGKSYDVQILARNDVGPSDWSGPVVETPHTIPSSPVISTIVNSADPGTSELTVTWTAPHKGGAEITRYDLRYIQSDAEDKSDANWTTKTGIWTSGTLEYDLEGLPKGVEHDIEVRAVNKAGEGGWSTTYSQTPLTAPGAPALESLEEDDEELTATWKAPGDGGGTAIAGYNLRYIETEAPDKADAHWTEEAFDMSSTDLEHTIDNLTNGTEYDVQVQAVNSRGDGLWSGTLQATPRTIPGAPTLNALTPGKRILTLQWTAPSDNGGATITSYDLQFKESDDEDIPANWDEVSPIWASGDLEYGFKPLDNGTGYDIQVRAYNEAGEGPWSNKESATPREAPGAPKIGSVTPGNAELTVTWAAPNDDGGDDVSSYNLRYIRTGATPQQKDDDAAWTPKAEVGTPTNRADTITGLDNGVEYDVQVQAVNTAGGGGWSDTETGTPRTTPDAPSISTLNSGDQSLTVLWSRPNNGGATITSYDLRYILESEDETDDANWTVEDSVWTSGPLEYDLDGLTNGDQYDVQMRAVNSAGEGPWSGTRRGTPETIPAAPTVDSPEADNRALKVTWSPPTDTGGGTLESYDLRHIRNDATDRADANWTVISPAGSLTNREYTITGLSNGVLYDVQLRAVTDVDPGPWSSTSSGTPRTTPGPVVIDLLNPGNEALTVSWSAPANSGGAAPTSYDLRYILSIASTTDKADATKWTEETEVGTSNSLQETINGLDNGTGYDVQVRAVNPAGDGTWSASSSATPRTTPSAPVIATVTSGR